MKKPLMIFFIGSLVGSQSFEALAENGLSEDSFIAFDAQDDWSIDQPALSDAIGFLNDLNQAEQESWLSASALRLPLERGEISRTSLSVRLNRLDRRDGTQRRGWYVFAGADDEALTLSGLAGTDIELRNHVNVGDVHVGLSFPAGAGQAALGYARRSVEYETKTFSATVEEDVLGLSYGLKF